jgi:hypothetical protein
MQGVSDAAPAFPRRDEHAWPRGAFELSVAVGLLALAGSAALVAAADSPGRALALLLVFVVLACLQGATYVAAVKPWLQGRPFPPLTRLVQVALLVLVLAAFAGGAALGGSALCGVLAGALLPNASTIRYVRVNQALVEEGEPELALDDEEHVPHHGPEDSLSTVRAPAERPVRARTVPKVGPVLRAGLAEERDRFLAWVAATLTAAVAALALGVPPGALFGIALLGVMSAAWVSRRVVGLWLALREFEGKATAPRRAFVVLLRDPNPRARRPLLGVWAEEPVPAGGRLPRAAAVYRCDATRDALRSTQGAVVVHEAWLDTGPRAGSRPGWVAADAGVALPQRRALFGRWYLGTTLGDQRPARARPLTMPEPNPTRENQTGTVSSVISTSTPDTGRWVRLYAGRLVVLAVAATVLTVLS